MVNAQEWLDRNYPKEQRENITYLDISNKNLKGNLILEDFFNLKEIDCSNNQLTNLDIDACYVSLTLLNCSNNELTELDLSTTFRLEKLDCSNNCLTDLKKLLNGLNERKLVSTSSGDFLERSVGDIFNMIPTKFMYNTASKVREIIGKKTPNEGEIQYLDLRNNNFSPTDLEIFKDKKFKYLEELLLGNSKEIKEQGFYNRFYGSLDFLNSLTKLNWEESYIRELNISDTNLDVGFAQQWLDHNYPKNTKQIIFDSDELEFKPNSELVIADYPNLEGIITRIGGKINNITKLTVNNCPRLAEVRINGWADNQELTINNCSNLTDLDCSENELSKLDLTGCSNLTEILCYSNQLTNLKFVQNLTKLKKLSIRCNNITAGLEYLPLSLKEFESGGEIKKELVRYGKNLIAWQQAHPKLMASDVSLVNLHLAEKNNTFLIVIATPRVLLEGIKKVETTTNNALPVNLDYTEFALRDINPFDWEKLGNELKTTQELPFRLYNIRDKKVEKTERRTGKYAIASYVWGNPKEESNKLSEEQQRELDNATVDVGYKNSNSGLTLLGYKSWKKVIEVCKRIGIDCLWMDQLCINQDSVAEKNQEVPKMRQYYNNAIATLIVINSEIGLWEGGSDYLEWVKHIIKQISTSPWFTRAWTFQEGLLSKQTVFVFDDYLVDGRELAKIWVGIQDSYALNQTTIFSTPLGWSYGTANEHSANLSLSSALDAVKHRQQTVALDGLYSILGLLPYGNKIKPKYKSKVCQHSEEEQKDINICQHNEQEKAWPTYSKEDLNQALQELMSLAIQENPYEAISWFGERFNDKSWPLPQIKEDGSTNIKGFVNIIKAQPEALQITEQGILLVGVVDDNQDDNYITITPDDKQIISDKLFVILVPKPEYINLPIKIEENIYTSIGSDKIFIDMINKQVIEGEEEIEEYQAQIEINPNK